MPNTPPPPPPKKRQRSFGSSAALNRLIKHLEALKAHSRRQGIYATAKWLAGKTVFSRWTAVVFSENSSTSRHPSDWPKGYRFAPLVPVSDLSKAQLQLLKCSGFQDLATQLAGKDEIYWVSHGDAIVCVGAVLYQSPQRSVLGLPEEAVLVGHCETSPSHRNKGLYARAINDTLLELRRRGFHSVFMETRPSNVLSQKGIERAGLRRDRVVDARIFFRSIVVRRNGVQWIKRS